MIITCFICKIDFHRKPSEIIDKNFCSRKCHSLYKKSLLTKDDRKVNKFIKSSWISLNIRAGKYKHLQTEEQLTKNKCYKDVKIEFSRIEYKEWCLINMDKIIISKRPSVDRLDSNKNYKLNNIQIIELEENCKKKKTNNAYIDGIKSQLPRGVSKHKKKWRARLRFQNNERHLGIFNTKEEAEAVFKAEYYKLHGKYPY